MNSLIFYLGTFYILIGTIFLTVPIIYLQLGKPKDLIKAFLNLLIGLILIVKNKTIDQSLFLIFLFLKLLNPRLIDSNIFKKLFLNSKKVLNFFFSLSVNWYHLDKKSSTR